MRNFEKEYDYTPARTLGEWRLPAGLRRALPYYFRRKWVSFGEPIPLFEHLHNTFGRIAHYRFLGTTIVFVNDPDWINEILVTQAASFVRERTLKRMRPSPRRRPHHLRRPHPPPATSHYRSRLPPPAHLWLCRPDRLQRRFNR
jgi:hypothetical protein